MLMSRNTCAGKVGPLCPKCARPLFAQAAAGVHYLHGRGFAHRDLKADNVFLTRDGVAKVSLQQLPSEQAPWRRGTGMWSEAVHRN